MLAGLSIPMQKMLPRQLVGQSWMEGGSQSFYYNRPRLHGWWQIRDVMPTLHIIIIIRPGTASEWVSKTTDWCGCAGPSGEKDRSYAFVSRCRQKRKSERKERKKLIESAASLFSNWIPLLLLHTISSACYASRWSSYRGESLSTVSLWCLLNGVQVSTRSIPSLPISFVSLH